MAQKRDFRLGDKTFVKSREQSYLKGKLLLQRSELLGVTGKRGIRASSEEQSTFNLPY